jgi:hypothetical protein
VKRWIAGALTVLAASAGLAAAGPASASSSSWYQTYQVHRSGSFFDVAAISNANVWAVGQVWDSKGDTIYQPLIRHFDGSGWQTVTIPGSPKFETDQVTASAADNVWVIGLTPNSVAHSMAYRYDGSHWHNIPVPRLTYLQGAVALGPDNVWAYGSSGSVFAPHCDVSASEFHWNGRRWQGYCLDKGNLIPEGISASGRNNLWLAGAVWVGKVERAVVYRWNGTGWHNTDLPRALTDVPGVSALSPASVWLGWFTRTSSHALHWNGHRWLTQAIPAEVPADPTNVVPDGRGGYWFGDSAILTGTTWTSVPAIEATGGFGSVFRIPGTESFLEPTGVRPPNSTIQEPTLYRYDL